MSITKQFFGTTEQGVSVDLYTLTNKNNLKLTITNYGGKMVQLYVPDKGGVFADIILGFDKLDSYLLKNPYFGSLIGRCANRLGNAQFTLNGKQYDLDCNTPPNQLHGGAAGFDKRVWDAEIIKVDGLEKLELKLKSEDGDQGYPGSVWVTVQYHLTDYNEVAIEYFAHCDADTIVNLTNHCYFNLAGHDSGDVLKQMLQIQADYFTPTDGTSIPTGELRKVENTPFDFRSMTAIGERISDGYEQLARNDGYDINYMLNKKTDGLEKVCVVVDPESGRRMETLTTMPAVQLYTANYIKGTFIGKGDYTYNQYCGFCLETQYPPNSPNIPSFQSITLHPGEEYRHKTVYAFSIEK